MRVPKDVAEKIGLEHLLIETDCPYLTPHPYRGTLNEPANVVYIAQGNSKAKEHGDRKRCKSDNV